MKKKETVSEKIEKAKESASKTKKLRELCEEIFEAFEIPTGNTNAFELMPSEAMDQVAPWTSLAGGKDEEFEKLYTAMKVSFAFGYAIGQALDVPEIDTKPILDFLREKKSLLYLPHEKKAA